MSQQPPEPAENFVHTGFRLPRRMRDDVAALARRLDIDRSMVHRAAIKALLEYVRRHKGHLVLPLDLEARWQQIQK